MVTLVLYVDRVRIKKNVSIRELAELAGISKSQVQRSENGTSNPSLKIMCQIAKALEVPVTDLFHYE